MLDYIVEYKSIEVFVLEKEVLTINKAKNYLVLGNNFYVDNKKIKSIKAYEKSLEFIEDLEARKDILFNIAHIYGEMGDHIKAIEAYEKILAMDKTEAGAYYGLAIVQEDLGELELSLKLYNKAIEMDSEYDRAYFFGANIYDVLGETEKAIEYYRQVINLVPDDYMAYNNLGAIYEERGEYQVAKDYIEKSIEINDDYDKAYYNLGVINKRLGNDDEALKLYERAKEINPHYGNIYLNISEILIDRDLFLETIDLLSEGIINNPDVEELYYNRACCYSILRMETKAISDVRDAIRLNPSAIYDVIDDEDFDNLLDNLEFQKIISDKER